MADCSRPPAHNQQKKNFSSVFGFRNKGTYDDVFESRPKMRAPSFTPGVNDYAEIFNCNKGSSIPALDLELFEKREEVVDYVNVFGGMSDAAIGSSYEEVFRGNGGVRRSTFDPYSHSRRSPKAAEESQKLPNESLLEKKHGVPSDIFIGNKGDTDETNSFSKTSEVPMPARAFDGTVPPKKSNVGATAVKFQQESDEVPVGKHSSKVSSSGLYKHGTDGFIDVDMRSRNGYGSDKSVSSETPMYENLIRPNVQMSEAILGTDSKPHLNGSMATSKSGLINNNNHEESHEGSNRSSNDGARVQSTHGSKPFTRVSTEDESVMKPNVSKLNFLSSDYAHDHGTAFTNPAIVTGNPGAHSSNGSENCKKDRHHESSENPATHPQSSFSKTNTLCGNNIIPDTIGSIKVDSKCTEKDSNEYLANSVKSENETEQENPFLKKASTEKSDVYNRSAYASIIDNNSSCSSDDEIDKNTEAFVSSAAVKKAMKEAQALINIAKESHGVKGFMRLSKDRNYGKSKVVKEEHNPKVKEYPKFIDPGLAEIKNNFSTSAARKDYPATWSASSARKMAPADMVVREVYRKCTDFSELNNVGHMKNVKLEMKSTSRETTQEFATTPLKLPSVNSFQEKLAALHLHNITDATSGQVKLVPEAYSSPVPNSEMRKEEVKPSIHEGFLGNNHESCTETSITGAKNKSQNASSNSDQDFMVQSLHVDFVKTEAGCSANSFNVKQDTVVVNEHTHVKKSEVIEVVSEGQVSSKLTSLEEENVKESKLDAHDQVLDYDDTDSQDYASAEENWESTDTEDEISNKECQLSFQNNLDEIEEMQNAVAPTIISDVFVPTLNTLKVDQPVGEAHVSDEAPAMIYDHSDLNPVVEEIDKTECMMLQNTVTRAAEVNSKELSEPIFNNASEDPIVKDVDESEKHKVKLISEEKEVPVFIYSNEDPIVEEADVSEDAPVLFNVTPKVISPVYSSSSPFNIADEDPIVETEHNMETPEAIITFENDTDSCYAHSDEDQLVGDNAEQAAIESSVRLHDNILEKETLEATKSHEHITIHTDDSVAVVETEPTSCADHESSVGVGSEVELILENGLSVKSGADAIEEFRSTPDTFESNKQEVDHTNFSDLDHQTDSEELQNEIWVKSDATWNVKGFENNHVIVDAAGKDDVNDTDSFSLNSEHVIDEMEAEVQLSEPVLASNEHTEPSEFKQLSDNFIQPVEKHERRKWEIPRETFELPELETGESDFQVTTNQEGVEMERSMDKPERKKWEIPNEAFELPVLDDEILEENVENVGPVLDDVIVEENVEDVRLVLDDEIVENVGHETERAMQSAEKPERKKWNIQKEVLDVPIICAEVVEDASDHEGLIPKAPSVEDTGMMDSASDKPAETVHLDEVQIEYSVSDEVAPDKGASYEPFVENTEEDIAKHQQEINIVEGKVTGQEECTKVSEEINVKDEIKRTLGMFWKRILKVKQGEDSDEELEGKDNATSSNRTGGEFERDLNLNGPVELVESPRQLDDNEAVSFSTNEESKEATSYSESFEVHHSNTCKTGKFVSVETTEEQRSSPLTFDSSKYQEGEKQSSAEEACNKNYVVEPQSEGVLSNSGSDDETEMAPTHAASDLKEEGSPKCNIQPSNVNENSQIDSEAVNESNPLQHDESLEDYEKSTQKTTKLTQQNGLKNEDYEISDKNMSEVEVETPLVDELTDKRSTDSEQGDANSSRQDTDSASDSEVPDVAPSHEYEQKAGKNETFPDRIEQSQTWKWIFGDDLKDKSNEQVKESDSEVEAKTNETADEIHTSNVTIKEKINGDEPTSMQDKTTVSMHKEPDQVVLKNSMRAKELERIAVERAIREARERAFLEARERAAKEKIESRERVALERANSEARERERANADARQKVNSTGQERFQRTSSEPNLASEKNSLEAKRKAEIQRAAVERATTEARQRALEKAMSRKEQVTQSSSSRNSNDQHGSSSNSKTDDGTSESALRFKARNERHQRIAERAAQALAEKNMRDLLVQREQAERNRLAEVLDADVKRWARGKTGNLRALLSTLQYILGQDSGWQAIQLTEIVTADAVKKAYRKATLFVHPDKLQQRGATIRQKYICEKVFDLLKEAWTKFDRDER